MTFADVLSCDWHLWLDGDHAPGHNMAMDEALLEQAAATPSVLVRFYGWQGDCFSIGCFQSADSAPDGYPFVRRPTGGGVVDHRNDFTYTVVFPKAHPVCLLEREESYALVNRAVIAALEALQVQATLTRREIPDHVDRRTMVCFTNPTKYDVVLGSTKVAGAAQRRRKEGILHQGSIDLKPLPRSVTRKALAHELKTAFEHLFGQAAGRFEPLQRLFVRAAELNRRTYSRREWNFKR